MAGLKPIHPGEILKHDFLDPWGLSANALATALGVSPGRINEIVRGCRGITASTALRLARYFGTSPGFWINLQARHDLDVAERTLRRTIDRQVEPRATRAAQGASSNV